MKQEQAVKFVCRDFTLEKGWRTLEQMLFQDRQAPPIQRLEMKKMYYAAFNELWRIMSAIAAELPRAEAQKKLEDLCAEAAAFATPLEQVH